MNEMNFDKKKANAHSKIVYFSVFVYIYQKTNQNKSKLNCSFKLGKNMLLMNQTPNLAAFHLVRLTTVVCSKQTLATARNFAPT